MLCEVLNFGIIPADTVYKGETINQTIKIMFTFSVDFSFAGLYGERENRFKIIKAQNPADALNQLRDNYCDPKLNSIQVIGINF